MKVLLSDKHTKFPAPETFDEDGLIAIGGNLSPTRLLEAYRLGIFPWYEPGQPILWWSPNPRLILLPDSFKCSRSLKQRLKKPFRLTIDTSFHSVIQACATSKGRKGQTWISEDMMDAYNALHHLGYAHSFEVWDRENLVGGLYGISLGRAFFGESMFHTTRDASKLALYCLCSTLKKWRFDFIDCQLPTPHLQSLGATTIERSEFLRRLKLSLQFPSYVGKWRD